MSALNTSATFTTRPTLQGTFGMTASTHWLATATGQSVLERGGNAFDAATAAAFVLHVVEPHLNGPGGDMTGIFTTAEAPGTPVVMMGQGTAPAGASTEYYRSLGLDLVPGAGALATAIPAAVDAWFKLLEEHGTWEIADILQYAIDYAENGHTVLPGVCDQIAMVEGLFTEHWPTSAAQWMPEGRLPEPGDMIHNPEYAQVLRELIAAGEKRGTPATPATPVASATPAATSPATTTIAADATGGRAARIAAAREEWRTGRVAQLATEFVRTPHRHSDGRDYAGVIAAEDFAGSSAHFEDAATIEFRGYTIAKTGAWGQGPTLLEALRILDGFDDTHLDPSTELGAHTIMEALKLAFADREAHFGDGDVDLEALLTEEYISARRALIGDTASAEFRPGTLHGSTGFVPPLRTAEEYAAQQGTNVGASGGGEPTVRAAAGSDAGANASAQAAAAVDVDGGEPGADTSGAVRGDTCHIDVVDRWGNMISATPSGGWLQSSPTIPGLGFNLGTRLQMTWLDETAPSALIPGKRPRTTLTPTLILKDGQPYAALGSPGGDQQDQWQLLLILRMLVSGMTLQEAIDAPAFHTTSMPGSFWPRTWTPGGAMVEDRLGDDVIAGLEKRGHIVRRAGDWALGRLSAVTRDAKTGILRAGANARGAQGYAAGR